MKNSIKTYSTQKQKYSEVWQLDKAKFVYGRGHRKTAQQRHYEKPLEYGAKLEEYVEKLQTCGEGRNSYSKTDHSATFMRVKKDYMGNLKEHTAFTGMLTAFGNPLPGMTAGADGNGED